MGSHGKGKAWERKLCRALQDEGCVARRIPLSGAMRVHGDDYKDDVVIDIREGELRVEVKYRRNGEKFKNVLRWFAENPPGRLLLRLPNYLVVSHFVFAEYVRTANDGEGEPSWDTGDIHDRSDVTPRKGFDTWRDGADALVLCRAYDPIFYFAIPLHEEAEEGSERAALFEWVQAITTRRPA